MRYCADTEAAFTAIVRASSVVLARATGDLSETAHRIARRTHAAVERADERLGMRIDTLARNAPSALERAVATLDERQTRILDRAGLALDRSSGRLDVVAARLAALDPAVQLARGWSITRDAAGRVVRSIYDVATGDTLTIAVADGRITSTVTSTERTPR
jgi:exodeoxyribonuclease VII large subunit